MTDNTTPDNTPDETLDTPPKMHISGLIARLADALVRYGDLPVAVIETVRLVDAKIIVTHGNPEASVGPLGGVRHLTMFALNGEVHAGLQESEAFIPRDEPAEQTPPEPSE